MEIEKEDKDKKKVVEIIEVDQTTENFIKTIIETISQEMCENKHENWRMEFDILSPDGELRTIPMYPAETIEDVQDRLNKRFGPDCVYVGLKKGGTTKDPDSPMMLGMYLEDDYRECISIVTV